MVDDGGGASFLNTSFSISLAFFNALFVKKTLLLFLFLLSLFNYIGTLIVSFSDTLAGPRPDEGRVRKPVRRGFNRRRNSGRGSRRNAEPSRRATQGGVNEMRVAVECSCFCVCVCVSLRFSCE